MNTQNPKLASEIHAFRLALTPGLRYFYQHFTPRTPQAGIKFPAPGTVQERKCSRHLCAILICTSCCQLQNTPPHHFNNKNSKACFHNSLPKDLLSHPVKNQFILHSIMGDGRS